MSTPSGKEVVQKILELSKQSTDRLVTYRQIWAAFRPDEAWNGNHSRNLVSQWLSAGLEYCVDSGWPIVTALVVGKTDRKLSQKAINSIFSEAKALGVGVGLSPKEFAEQQQNQAKLLNLKDLESS